jgi:hypothetical protein
LLHFLLHRGHKGPVTRSQSASELGALEGIRTPNLLIRRLRHIVQDRPLRSVRWADIPQLSTPDRCCPAAWQQYWQQSRRNGLGPRPSAFQPGYLPSYRPSCGCRALSPVADGSGWLLLLPSPLLSAVGPVPDLRGLRSAMTAPGPAQAPPPNPSAADLDDRRVLSRGGAADHEVTPQAPLTGSGCREHSYGGFGGGHPPFHLHARLPAPPRLTSNHRDTRRLRRRTCRPIPLVDGMLRP